MNHWPRVTQILKDFGFYANYNQPFINGKSAMQRGSYVDMACNIIAAGNAVEPRWIVDHPECEPYIQAFKRFLEEHQWRMLDCQREVIHTTERYIGHYDQFGRIDNGSTWTLLSLKTGDIPDWCALQEAFYVNAIRNAPSFTMGVIGRMALQLKNDGTYTLREFKDPRDLSEASTLARAWWVRCKYLGRGESA